MADTFTEFVLKIASDPQALAQYQRNPDAAMNSAGLSSAEASVLKSGNPALIRQTLIQGLGPVAADDGTNITVVVVITLPAPQFQSQLLGRFRQSPNA